MKKKEGEIMGKLNYDVDLELNRYNLDEEAVKQPVLYMQYQELMIDKKKEIDDMKIQIDVIKNQLKTVEGALWIRIKNQKIDNKNPTDKLVEATVLTNPEREAEFVNCIDRQKEMNILNQEFGILEAAVKSFEQRKKSLEHLVGLDGRGYYSAVDAKNNKIQSDEINERINK